MFHWYGYGFFRSVLFCYLGATVLGTYGNLGIGASIATIIVTAITITILIELFFKCVELTDDNQASQMIQEFLLP